MFNKEFLILCSCFEYIAAWPDTRIFWLNCQLRIEVNDDDDANFYSGYIHH